MKRLLILVAVIGIGFTACKKREVTPEPTTEEKIIGTWMGDEIETSITAPPPIGNQNETEDISYLNIEFRNDGTAVADSAGLNADVTNWSVTANDQLILEGDTFDIQKLDASNFHFGLSETETVFGSEVSTTISIKLKK